MVTFSKVIPAEGSDAEIDCVASDEKAKEAGELQEGAGHKKILTPTAAALNLFAPSRPLRPGPNRAAFPQAHLSEKHRREQLDTMLRLFDVDGNGIVSKEEVVHAIAMRQAEGQLDAALVSRVQAAVDSVDDGDGQISTLELEKLLQTAEEKRNVQIQKRMTYLSKQVLLAKQREDDKTSGQGSECVIDPRSNFHFAWDMFVSLAIAVTAITVPLALGWGRELSDAIRTINFTIDAILMCDVGKNFVTGYVDKDSFVVLDQRKIIMHYAQTWLWLDLLSAVPSEPIAFAISQNETAGDLAQATRILRFTRLVRIIHLFRLFHMKRLLRALRWFGYGLEEKLHFSFSEGPMQVAKLGMLVMITAHWMGCLNFMLARMWHFPEDSWVVAADLVGASLGAQYAWSLFKAMAQLIMIGFDSPPLASVSCTERTEWCSVETWSTLAGLYIGAVIYAYIISQLSSILFNSETARRAFDERISYLDSYARRLRLPRELRQKVRDYYHVKYKDGRLDNDDEILRDLNPSLREEILLHKAYQFTSKVPLLSRSPEQFKAGIISMLQSTISFPGDVILREGTTGNAVFFIDSGVVEIRSQLVDNRVVTAIADGCYFGEVSALLGCKRTATATAKTVCIMYTCDAKKFVGLLDGFKDLMSHVENVARKRRRRIESFGDGFNPVLMGLQADNDSIYDEDEEDAKTRIFAAMPSGGITEPRRHLKLPKQGAPGPLVIKPTSGKNRYKWLRDHLRVQNGTAVKSVYRSVKTP